ncbi:thioredoxin family protein [Fibrobacter sp.]|uniref:protein-disulfide reductase DsbD family protein n=1 Tax=Fibrobacter sp. TaxID=35828 RepID=UPI0026297D0D|nr:thioredoxin family protein [Fibrobacter sp.]MDD5943469.1 thioredoxin family protein [Fibrobacter sp.]
MNSMPPPDMLMEYSAGALKDGGKITVSITVPDKWHVNANEVTDEFLKPSSIEVKAEGIEFGDAVWPAPIREYNEALELEILTFRGTFTVEIPVKGVAKNGDGSEAGYDSLGTEVTFHYQACDNSICLAPASKTIRLDGKSAGNGTAAKSASKFTIENATDNSSLDGTAKKNDPEVEGNASGDLDSFASENRSSVASENRGSVASENRSSVASENRGSVASENRAGVLALLFFAFIGGIILNLMPCVLPVLSLKLFSLIKQAGESRGRLLALGGATTAGILCSFWILAAVVAAVKAGGGSAGWGMQFQNAGFIAFMVVILTAFAMSFFGVFEIWLPWNATTRMDAAGHKAGLAGAFFTGALLVLLSTPCSAPFLGTAMGFAFTASTPVLFLFFTAAGLGLALPYILVSAFPKILKVFPKPGAWMVRLQKVMGVLLLATVAWLLWLVNEQAGMAGVGMFAVIVAASIGGSIIVGKFAPPGAAFKRELITLGGSIVVIAAVWFAVIAPQYDAAATEHFNARMQEQMTADGWYRYSPALIEEFAKAKRTVFIDATADWCLTCKTNEAAVLNRDEFRRTMDSLNVALVKADWTRETPEVNALLHNMGKSGVPAYAIYPAGDANKKIVLPELLTTAAIVEKIVGSRK